MNFTCAPSTNRKMLTQLITIEFYKLFKSRLVISLIIIAFISSVVSICVFKILNLTTKEDAGINSFLFSEQNSLSIIILFSLLFSSTSLTLEKSSGTIRNILLSGVSYKNILISKVSSYIFLSVLLYLTSFLSSLIGSHLLFGLKNLYDDGLLIVSIQNFLCQFGIASIVCFFSLLALNSYGLFISSLCHNPLQSSVISIASYLIFELIQLKLSPSPFLPFIFSDEPFKLLNKIVDGLSIEWFPFSIETILSSILICLAFLLLSLFFSKK